MTVPPPHIGDTTKTPSTPKTPNPRASDIELPEIPTDKSILIVRTPPSWVETPNLQSLLEEQNGTSPARRAFGEPDRAVYVSMKHMFPNKPGCGARARGEGRFREEETPSPVKTSLAPPKDAPQMVNSANESTPSSLTSSPLARYPRCSSLDVESKTKRTTSDRIPETPLAQKTLPDTTKSRQQKFNLSNTGFKERPRRHKSTSQKLEGRINDSWEHLLPLIFRYLDYRSESCAFSPYLLSRNLDSIMTRRKMVQVESEAEGIFGRIKHSIARSRDDSLIDESKPIEEVMRKIRLDAMSNAGGLKNFIGFSMIQSKQSITTPEEVRLYPHKKRTKY